MLFNSLDFAIFLPIVFIIYWFLLRNKYKIQNLLIVIASYVFYGWWDYRFLALIIFSTIVDYVIGNELGKNYTKNKRKTLLIVSVAINLGFLGFFKYYNFFVDNFIEAFSFFGHSIQVSSLNVILPVGISFYTFQTLSYSIDVYRNKIEPTKDLISFAAFVSFFPQLVAGPIERASHLLPQFYKNRKFNYLLAVDGLRQILWGLFKKIVIADNCAEYANLIFNNSNDYSGSTLVLGALFFTFQIYCDFSGYSDIAIGVSRLFGFDLKRNFAFPYFSRDVGEFWRRWHISLSTWFRDYLYIPLGGSRGSKFQQIRNTFIIFIVSGFWHGANWTFIIWGALNALYFLPLLLSNKNRSHMEIVAAKSIFPNVKELFLILGTFSLTVLTWIFFRAENVTHAINYLSSIFSSSLFSFPLFSGMTKAFETLIFIAVFILIEWIGRKDQYAIERIFLNNKRLIRHLFYYSIVIAIIFFGGSEQEFIYFQF